MTTRYRIDRAGLDAFIAEQVDVIEQTPLPADLALILEGPETGPDAAAAVWLAAGLASQVGLVLLSEPERFVDHAPALRVALR